MRAHGTMGVVNSLSLESAHGAGLMVVPVLLGSSTVEAQSGMAAGHNHVSATASPLAGMLPPASIHLPIWQSPG